MNLYYLWKRKIHQKGQNYSCILFSLPERDIMRNLMRLEFNCRLLWLKKKKLGIWKSKWKALEREWTR